jgi:hypothetical protein
LLFETTGVKAIASQENHAMLKSNRVAKLTRNNSNNSLLGLMEELNIESVWAILFSNSVFD